MGALLALEAYTVRSLLAVRMREGIWRAFSPPAFNDTFILIGIAIIILAVSAWVCCKRSRADDRVYIRDQSKLALLAIALGTTYALAFNRWSSTTSLPQPSAVGPVLGALGATVLLGWIVLRRNLAVRQLARGAVILALLAVAILTVYFAWPASDRRPHVIVSLWDTARSSRMSLYGYQEDTTPELNAQVGGGVIFDWAYSPSNYTYPSHVSLFLGKSYRSHNYHIGDMQDVDRYRQEFTLADLMKLAGYHPILFAENLWVLAADKGFAEVRAFPILDSYPEPPKGECEFGGFSPLRNYAGPFLGRMLVDAVAYWFDGFYAFTLDRIQLRCLQEVLVRSRRTGPVFLFWNIMTVHNRYHPFGSWYPGEVVKNYPFAREYGLGLRRADRRFGDMYRRIVDCGQRDRTLLIVTSDHGEFLGEENLFGHNKALFEPVLRVPLAFFHPRLDGRRVARPVSLTSFRHLMEALLAKGSMLTSEELEAAMAYSRPVVSEYGHLPYEGSRKYEWCYTILDEIRQFIYDPLIGTYSSLWPPHPDSFLFQRGGEQKPETNRSASEPDHSQNFWRWGLCALIIALVIWQSVQLMIQPIHGDEAEHAHAAYHISRGERQFVDFFEHHFPGLWYLLLPYYVLGGYGAGVLFWGRAICIISMLVIVGFCYLIGRRIGPSLTGELAALIPLPFGIANQYLQVRPECIMLPLVLAGIYGTVRFLQDKNRGKWFIAGLVMVSLSLFFSPRSLIVLGWLVAIFFINLRGLSTRQRALAVPAIAVGPLMLFGVVGWHDCYTWLPKLPGAFLPLMPFHETWDLLSGKYVLVAGVAGGLIALVRCSRAMRYLSILLIIMVALLIIQILSEIRTPCYAWAIASTLAAIILAYWCGVLISGKGRMSPGAVSALLFIWLGSSIFALARRPLMLTADGKNEIPNPHILSGDIREMDSFCRRYENLGPAWIVWDFDVRYIPVEDFSYYSSPTYDMPATFARLGIPSPVPRWLADIKIKSPFAISKNLVDDFLKGPDMKPEWWNWFNNSYRPLKRPRGDYFYWRRDVQVSPEDIARDK
ncbi:MAG: sulfatase-like hydrolase/transferase [Candidatus Aureabacteria bacterium]|nr:sulfatase-like hydrolase/transferase [Candidatus Auribacterota bacterium]